MTNSAFYRIIGGQAVKSSPYCSFEPTGDIFMRLQPTSTTTVIRKIDESLGHKFLKIPLLKTHLKIPHHI